MATVSARLKVKNDTSANWELFNPILLPGEIGYETDTKHLKIGDGLTPWNELPYHNKYSQVVIVSKSGGDYDNINSALSSISDASEFKNYVILLYPGEYTENIVMLDYIDIVGFGKTSVINGSIIFSNSVQSTLSNVIIFSLDHSTISFVGMGEYFLNDVVCVSQWDTNTPLNDVVHIANGSVYINPNCEFYLMKPISFETVSDCVVFSMSGAPSLNLTVNNIYCNIDIFDANDNIAIFASSNTSPSTNVSLVNNRVDISTGSPSAINNILFVNNSSSGHNVDFINNKIDISGQSGNTVIGYLNHASISPTKINAANNIIYWNRSGNIQSSNVFIGASVSTNDTVFVTNDFFSYTNSVTGRFGGLGADGVFTYNITAENGMHIINGLVSLSNGVFVDRILDEDDMVSDDELALATQQSIKSYVDTQVITVGNNVYFSNTPPPSNSNLIWIEPNSGIAFIYDPLRLCWLSVMRQSLVFGVSGNINGSQYLYPFSQVTNPDFNYLMIRDTVITAVTGKVVNTIGADPFIRIEADYVPIGYSLSFGNNISIAHDNLNGWTINQGQTIMCFLGTSKRINDPQIWIEFAWRYDV